MKLQTLLNAYGYKIVDGDTFLWDCWPNTHGINIETNTAKIYVYFNLDTTEIHEINVDIVGIKSSFKWFNPSSLVSYKKEAIKQKVVIEENNPSLFANMSNEDVSRYVSQEEIIDPVALKLLS